MLVFQFPQVSEDVVSFNDSHKYWTYTNHKILKYLIFQIISGYITGSAANIVQHDSVLQTFSTDEPMVSRSSISRTYNRLVGMPNRQAH